MHTPALPLTLSPPHLEVTPCPQTPWVSTWEQGDRLYAVLLQAVQSIWQNWLLKPQPVPILFDILPWALLLVHRASSLVDPAWLRSLCKPTPKFPSPQHGSALLISFCSLFPLPACWFQLQSRMMFGIFGYLEECSWWCFFPLPVGISIRTGALCFFNSLAQLSFIELQCYISCELSVQMHLQDALVLFSL